MSISHKFLQSAVKQIPSKKPLAREALDVAGFPFAAGGVLQLDAIVALGGAASADVDDLAGGNGCDLPRDGRMKFDSDD